MQNFIPSVQDFDPHYIYPFNFLDPVTVATKFEPSRYERDIRPHHVKEIKDALLRGSYIPPITVNLNNRETVRIIDGQHRWKAWLEAVEEGYTGDLLVTFVDKSDKEEYDLFRELNSGLSVSNRDIFKVAVNNGVKNVVKLNEFAKAHAPLTWNKHNSKPKLKLVETLIFGTYKGSYTKRHGDYDDITDEMLEYAGTLASEIQSIFDVTGFDCSGSKDSTFAGAWYNFRKRNPYSRKYTTLNAMAVDKVGIEKFAEKLKDHVLGTHGLETLNQSEWFDAFLAVTYEYVK